jgi:hypothetical protein
MQFWTNANTYSLRQAIDEGLGIHTNEDKQQAKNIDKDSVDFFVLN